MWFEVGAEDDRLGVHNSADSPNHKRAAGAAGKSRLLKPGGATFDFREAQENITAVSYVVLLPKMAAAKPEPTMMVMGEAWKSKRVTYQGKAITQGCEDLNEICGVLREVYEKIKTSPLHLAVLLEKLGAVPVLADGTHPKTPELKTSPERRKWQYHHTSGKPFWYYFYEYRKFTSLLQDCNLVKLRELTLQHHSTAGASAQEGPRVIGPQRRGVGSTTQGAEGWHVPE